MQRFFPCLVILAIACLLPLAAYAQPKKHYSKGQIVMVPVHNHLYLGPKRRPLPLNGDLFLINPNLSDTLEVSSVILYNSLGDVHEALTFFPQDLRPYTNLRIKIPKMKKTGLLIIEWRAAKPIHPLYVEAIYVAAAGQQGISFTSHGQVVEELK